MYQITYGKKKKYKINVKIVYEGSERIINGVNSFIFNSAIVKHLKLTFVLKNKNYLKIIIYLILVLHSYFST